ncbi:MAG: ATP-grasp domain-containing protein [Methanobacteriaceae archaeon]
MKKLLILGVNTRPLVNSALKLNYKTYSGSYFKPYDFKEPYMEKHIINQKADETCGYFEDNYSYDKVLELYESNVYNDIDHIILYTGISPNNLPKNIRKKILGNKDTKDIENKYTFHKKLRKLKKIKNKSNTNNENVNFCIPKTFKANDVYDAIEIANQHNNLQFIVKPIEGSGGYGVNYLNNLIGNSLNHSDDSNGKFTNIKNKVNRINSSTFENPFILQEYIKGVNVSSSILSTGKVAKSIFCSYNNSNNANANGFIYQGNTTPYDNLPISSKLASISENIISIFNLIGSNGVDMIISNNKDNNNNNNNGNNSNNTDNTDNYNNTANCENIYIIEVNPRIQGSYECGEQILGINMLEAHIKACYGEIIRIPKANGVCIKEIIYSNSRIKVNDNIINMISSNSDSRSSSDSNSDISCNSKGNRSSKSNVDNLNNISDDNIGNIDNINNIINDIPYPNTIIEKNQPVATIISHKKTLNAAKDSIELGRKKINSFIQNIE